MDGHIRLGSKITFHVLVKSPEMDEPHFQGTQMPLSGEISASARTMRLKSAPREVVSTAQILLGSPSILPTAASSKLELEHVALVARAAQIAEAILPTVELLLGLNTRPA